MNDKDLISIIVPFYNSEKYIEKCIYSLINQTYDEIELIFIDDASTDKSYELASKFKQIKIIKNKDNKGVSYSRNLGIEQSTGNYIFFVDSDDYVSKDCIEKLHNLIKQEKADIVGCNVIKKNIFKKEKTDIFYYNDFKMNILNEEKEVIISKNEIKNLIVSMLENKYYRLNSELMGYSAGKLYKKEVIKNLKFNEKIHFREDTLFNLYAFMNSNKIIFLKEKLYFYTTNLESASFKFFKYYEDEINEYFKILKDINENKKSIYIWGVYMYMAYLKHYAMHNTLNSKEQNKALKDTFESNLWKEIFSSVEYNLLNIPYKFLVKFYLCENLKGIKLLYRVNNLRKRIKYEK